MFNTTNLLDQVNEQKMEFLHNRILREAGKREEQYISKLIVESLLDEEISELISFEEAVQNMMRKLTPVVEKALLVNPLGMKYPIIKEHVGYEKINIEDWIRTSECLAAGDKSNNSEEIEEGALDRTKPLRKNAMLTLKLKKKHGILNVDIQGNGQWERLHPFLLEYVTYAKTLDDIAYIKQDYRAGIKQLTKLADNYESVEKGNPNKGVSVKSLQNKIDHGQSSKKIRTHLKWMETTYKVAIDKQFKKIKETVKESTTIFSGYKDIEDKLMKSCNIKDVLSPYTTEEPKEIILGSVTDDIVKEAAEELSMTTSFINNAIDKAIKLKAHCYGSVLDINNKIETINMNDNYAEEDVLNTEAAKMMVLEQCLKSVAEVSRAIKNIKSTFVEDAKFITSVANYNPRSFKESNDNIMDNLNMLEQIIEFCLVINEDNKPLEEIEESDTINKMKAKLVLSNKRFLEKYSNAAKKSNCLGITMKEWYKPKDIDKQFKQLTDEVNKKFGKDYKSVDALEADYKRLKGNILGLGGEYSSISKKQLNRKSVALTKELAFVKEKNHIITKSDVDKAIKMLETVSRQIDQVYVDRYNSSILSICGTTKANSCIGKTKEERLYSKIDTMKKSLLNLLQGNYYAIKLEQVKILQKQSRLVIMKAARQKPTNEEATIMINLESCIDEIGEIIMR